MSTEMYESKNGQTIINYPYKTEEISGKFLHVVNERHHADFTLFLLRNRLETYRERGKNYWTSAIE